MINVHLSDIQAKQLSISISMEDVLNCIKRDVDSYLSFVNEEYKNGEINEEDYQSELRLIDNIKTDYTKNFIKMFLARIEAVNINICDNENSKSYTAKVILQNSEIM